MKKNKIKLIIVGELIFNEFKNLLLDSFSVVYFKKPDELLRTNINQSIIIVAENYWDKVVEFIKPQYAISGTLLVVFSKKQLGVNHRKLILSSGFSEIIPCDADEEELALLLKNYQNIYNFNSDHNKIIDTTFQQLLDASPAALRIVDLNKKILYSNDKYDEINNTFKGDIIGSDCKNYLCAWFCDSERCAVSQIQQADKPFFFEHTKTDLQGNKTYYLFDVKPFKDIEGKTIGIIESILDVTSVKSGELALKQSENRFKLFVEGSPLGIFIADNSGKYTYVNQAATKLTGYSKHEFKNMTIAEITDQKEYAFEIFDKLKNAQKISEEITLKAKNGDQIPVILDAVVIGKENFIAYCTDIRKLKNTEKKLKEYKLRLEELINQRTQELKIQEEKLKINYKVAHEGIWDYNIETGRVYFSPTYYTMLGYEPYEFKQSFDSWEELLHPDDRDTAVTFVDKFMKSADPAFNIEFRLRLKSGNYSWIRGYGLVLENDKEGNKRRVIGTHTNIHSEKLALISHLKTENKYKKLVEQINDWIWEIDGEGVYSYCSPHVENIVGYKPVDIIGKTPFDLMPPEEGANAFRIFTSYAINEKPFSGMVNRTMHKEGHMVYIETSGKPVYNEAGNYIGYMGVNRDVTERVKIEHSIIESEEQFRKIFHTTADLILITTRKGKILNINKPAIDLFNLKFGVYERIRIQELFNSENLNNYLKKFVGKELNVTEIEYTTEDGVKVFEVNGRSIPFKGNRAILNIFKDITVRKELERKVLQTVIDTEEKERSRFAKDLHDGLGPQLSAIRLYINSFGMAAYSEDKKLKMIENAKQIIDNAITSTKEIANNLMPSVLENFGLVQAVQLFCNGVSGANNININLENNNFNEQLPINTQIVLYRVVSELINNTIKHANASELFLGFESSDEENKVFYADNGKGFTLNGEQFSGKGIQNIKSRIKSINGHLKIISKPEKGIKVEIKV